MMMMFEKWLNREKRQHLQKFPLSENLTVLIFIVVSDLTEQQRERLQSTLAQNGLRVENYTFQPVNDAFRELFCAPRSSLENPSLRVNGQGHRSFCVMEDGEIDGIIGYWVQDDETGEEGFMGEFDNNFWVFDDMESVWQTRPIRKRFLRRRPAK